MLPWSRRETRMQLFAAFALAVGGGAGGERGASGCTFSSARRGGRRRCYRGKAAALAAPRATPVARAAPMHTIPTDVLGWSVRGDVAYVGVKDNATPARLVVERYCAGENAARRRSRSRSTWPTTTTRFRSGSPLSGPPSRRFPGAL